MNHEKIATYWNRFKAEHPTAPDVYEAWGFGSNSHHADELGKLVIEGKKTATTSNYRLYELYSEALPYPGLHNIILNGDEEPIAIVKTTTVEIKTFNEVEAEHAYLEGEGDRSLAYWREVHEDFFKREYEAINEEFHYKVPVVCERFELIYK
ncbi:ASCH domain-containing protein [Gracilibacillus oryzae]|uniref:ASCH domain-containing protein n=1 Tax=Gracilibacillus oryzae TaxID=1672701 RepID=A0A7C8KWN8_9BACI|nr:ASCH domain-containing protein [Gracilibacillus oryzae]KAB8138315.1 ASCH domain-containing protein [Gracilibacillus oryzae]